LVTVNSDDPTYFGGFLNDNFIALSEALDMGEEDVKNLAKNSFTASFLPEDKKRQFIDEINSH
jgi:adenosine deaminase